MSVCFCGIRVLVITKHDLMNNKRKLGESDIFITPITIGCWSFGGGEYWGKQSWRDVHDVVNTALDAGINAFDTAEMYNNGESEYSLGKALKGRREQAVIISKIGPSNCYYVREHCIESLKRLGTDYLDVYMIHWPINKLSVEHFTSDKRSIDTLPTIEETCAQLNELKKEGLIRAIGMSNFGQEQMKEILATDTRIAVNEISYNIVSRAIEAEIVPFCMKNNISIIGSMGLQQGLLAGIYRVPDDVPPHQAHSRHFSQKRGEGISRHNEAGVEKELFEVLEQLQRIADELHISMAQLSIAWTLKKPFMTSTLIGSRNLKQLKSNMEALFLELSDDTERLIDDISQPILDLLGNNPDYYENTSRSRIY